MKRPARQVQPGPPALEDITLPMALEYERTRWPSWRLRWAWWDRDAVPMELQNAAEPDPRRILGEVTPEEYRAEATAFQAARLCWLEEVAT